MKFYVLEKTPAFNKPGYKNFKIPIIRIWKRARATVRRNIGKSRRVARFAEVG